LNTSFSFHEVSTFSDQGQTLPEATPVHEAARLQIDLGRAKIRPFGWVINQSLTPVTTTDLVLRSRQANEYDYIAEVCDKLAQRVALVPWMSEPPTGAAGLKAMITAGGNL
jgi:arsenite/tail-anchored protein-transporting ATPase